jgi:hypothetical protein
MKNALNKVVMDSYDSGTRSTAVPGIDAYRIMLMGMYHSSLTVYSAFLSIQIAGATDTLLKYSETLCTRYGLLVKALASDLARVSVDANFVLNWVGMERRAPILTRFKSHVCTNPMLCFAYLYATERMFAEIPVALIDSFERAYPESTTFLKLANSDHGYTELANYLDTCDSTVKESVLEELRIVSESLAALYTVKYSNNTQEK